MDRNKELRNAKTAGVPIVVGDGEAAAGREGMDAGREAQHDPWRGLRRLRRALLRLQVCEGDHRFPARAPHDLAGAMLSAEGRRTETASGGREGTPHGA